MNTPFTDQELNQLAKIADAYTRRYQDEITKLKAALTKISAIRDSIIGGGARLWFRTASTFTPIRDPIALSSRSIA
jgi:hypothetical protein